MDEPDLNASTDNSASTQTMIAIVVIGLLLFGCVLVLIPFTSAILWAIILSFSSWNIFSGIKRVLGGRPSLAAVTMMLLLASIVVVPFAIVGTSLAGNVADVIEAIRYSLASGPLSPPQWINDVPLIGHHVYDYLTRLARDQTAQKALLHDLITPLKEIALELGKALGHGIFEISLSLVVCFFLYRDGDAAAARLETAAARIGDERGRRLLEVARVTAVSVSGSPACPVHSCSASRPSCFPSYRWARCYCGHPPPGGSIIRAPPSGPSSS
jgi:predicted PurR-regulated permease PerM